MYIKIRFKHILLMLGISLLLVVSGLYFRGYGVYMLGKANEIAGASDKAGVYYDRASEIASGSAASVQAAKSKIEMFLTKNSVSFMMNVDMHGNSTFLNGPIMDYESITDINQRYTQISVSAAKNNTLAEYAIKVAFMNYFAADANRALDILGSLDYITDGDLLSIKRLYTSMIKMKLGNMEEGFNEIKADMDKTDRFAVIRQELKRYYLFITGDFNGFSKVKIDSFNWYNNEDTLVKPLLSIHSDTYEYDDILKKESTAVKTGNSFTGRVTGEGRAMPYVFVYLKDAANKDSHSSLIGMYNGIKKIVLTDKEGYFHMDNVPNGTYGIGFCADWSRVSGKTVLMNKKFNLKFTGSTKLSENISFVDNEGMMKVKDMGSGKIKFEYNMPDGAVYYNILMGELRKNKDNKVIYNVNFTYTFEKIRENSYVVDTEKERLNGMVAGISYGSSGVDPYQWMEPFYHTGEYVYCVFAYDSKGDVVADSRGIYPVKKNETIHIQGSEWSEADRLLLDEKYDEAIKEYEKQAVTDSGDSLHAAKVLAKLYSSGWIYNSKTNQLEGENNTKAKKYFKMLDAKIDNDYFKNGLAHIYVKEKQYARALEIYLRLAEKTAFSYYYQIGWVYGFMGNYSKAEEAYIKYYEENGNGADRLMMLYVLEGRDDMLAAWASKHDSNSYFADYEKAVTEYIKIDRSRYAEFFNLIKSGKTTEAEQVLKADESELGHFYKGVLELQKYFDDYATRDKCYSGLYEKVKAPGIRELMKYFGKAGLNTGFGDK